MANEMRDRLVEFMAKRFKELYKDGDWNFNEMLVDVADRLLDDGWVRPPYKVGQTVYIIDEPDYEDEYVLDVKVKTIGQDDVGLWVALELPLGMRISEYISPNNIGKTVFLTKSEAEQKLKEIKK